MHSVADDKPLKSRVIKTELVDWRALLFIQNDNFKALDSAAEKKLQNSILENEFMQPFYVWLDETTGRMYCLDGRHRILALHKMAAANIAVPHLLPATFIDCADKKEAARLVLVYSSMYAKVTEQGLFDFLEQYELQYETLKDVIDLPGLDDIEFQALYKEASTSDTVIPRSLTERFLIPPFSVLDTRQGYWQDRKKVWHQLFDSQETREDVQLVARSGQAPAIYQLRNTMREALGREPDWDEIIAYAKQKGMHLYEGASIFDPVLSEIAYKWFCPAGGSIYDPFAGGSVRGIVAAVCGFSYHGIDLRTEQVEANQRQAAKLSLSGAQWYAGDSKNVNDILPAGQLHDFVFSCPPYHDLEQYSDDPADLSNMDYATFCDAYWDIIRKSMQRLKQNRFACFVVGDIRDEKGFYRNFVTETTEAFLNCLDESGNTPNLYNEIILVNVAGSLPVRVGRQFGTYRKVGKMHQNVLVFYKGDPKKIKDEFPEIKLPEDLQALDNQPNIAVSYN